MSEVPWTLHPDRALPTDPRVLTVARELYSSIANLPIISMHGHLDAQDFRDNVSLADPASEFVVPDHYLVRMLVSQGWNHSQVGIPPRGTRRRVLTDDQARAVWRIFCENWHLFRGTPTRFWLEYVMVNVFGVSERPSAQSSDRIFDHLCQQFAQPQHRVRELFGRFGIETLATTDSPLSDLASHTAMRDEGWGNRIIPTFRPDALFYPNDVDWVKNIDRLATLSGIEITDYLSFLEAIRQRRATFVRVGALATDHGNQSASTLPLDRADAKRLFDDARKGPLDIRSAHAFAANMLFESARMCLDDGLVMQLHPGVRRNHSSEIYSQFGPDQGFDIPVRTDFSSALAPMLQAFGLDPRFRLILFTVDESTYSRELAPLAGAYPSVKLGAPWWFLDAPEGLSRFRELVTETAGFYNTTGFVDDTRSFVSIPARHDLARRTDASYLAKLVAEHRLELDEAVETAIDLTYNLPIQAYSRPHGQADQDN